MEEVLQREQDLYLTDEKKVFCCHLKEEINKLFLFLCAFYSVVESCIQKSFMYNPSHVNNTLGANMQTDTFNLADIPVDSPWEQLEEEQESIKPKPKKTKPRKTEEEKDGMEEKKNDQKKKKKEKAGKELASAITTISALIAGFVNKPELVLTEGETNALSDAATEVASHYTLPDMGVTGAWVNLGLVIGAIVYPRYIAIKASKKEEEAKRDHSAAPL